MASVPDSPPFCRSDKGLIQTPFAAPPPYGSLSNGRGSMPANQISSAFSEPQQSLTDYQGPAGLSRCSPHTCPFCATSCKRPADLQRHIKSIHYSTAYWCPVAGCGRSQGGIIQYNGTVIAGKSFNRRDKMEEHLRKMHQGFNVAAVVPPTCSNGVASAQMEATISPTLNIGGIDMFNAVERGLVSQLGNATFTPNNDAAPERYYTSAPAAPDRALVSFLESDGLTNFNFDNSMVDIEGLGLDFNFDISMADMEGLEGQNINGWMYM